MGLDDNRLKCGLDIVPAKYNHITFNENICVIPSLVLLWLTTNLHSSVSLYLFNNIGFLSSLLPPPDLSLWLHHNSPSVLWHFHAYPRVHYRPRESKQQGQEVQRPKQAVGLHSNGGGFGEGQGSIRWAARVWETLWCICPQWMGKHRMTARDLYSTVQIQRPIGKQHVQMTGW